MTDPVPGADHADPAADTDDGGLDPPIPPPQDVAAPVRALARLLDPFGAIGGGGVPAPPGFEVIRPIGRGAMGDVYLARQLSLKRLVALKMIRADLHARGPQLRTRFQAEAEAVAQLQHPHIVQIHQVGEVAGRPYLALEYLADGGLDDRLKGSPLPATAAARLVGALASAVQHAHDRGIVHRDLKPGNVLMAADGTPKVTDFGLARAVRELADEPTDGAAADAAETLTLVGSVLGTPSYMAPEQAAGRHDLVGPRTDVYALGAILYECLTGRPPFRGGSVAETLDQVRHRDPVPVRVLRPGLPRDVGTVCLKCLEKDPDRRYQTAKELADDLDRFLRREPVRARPIGLPERLARWARRHPGPAVLAGLLVLACVGSVVGAVAYESHLRAARDAARQESEEATRQRRRAEANARQASDAVHRFLTRVGDDRLRRVPEMEGVRAELLRDALEFYQRLLADAADPDPAVRLEAARAHTRVGEIQRYLGRSDEAERQFRLADDRLGRLAAGDPVNPEYRRHHAAAAHALAELMVRAAPDRAAEPTAEARRRWQSLLAERPDDPEFARLLAECDHLEGLTHTTLGQNAPAEEAYRRALTARRALAGRFGDDPRHRRDLAFTLHNLGALYSRTGRPGSAREHEAEAVRLFEELFARDPADEESLKLLSAGLNNLGHMPVPGKAAEAVRSHRRSLELREELARRHPRVPDYQAAVGDSCVSLVATLVSAGRPAEAVEPGRRGVEVMDRLVREHPSVPAYRLTLAELLTNLSQARAGTGRLADAASDADRAAAVLELLVCEAPDQPLHWQSLAAACLAAGNLAGAAGRGRDALDWFGRGIAAAEEALRFDPRLAQARTFRLYCHGARAQTLLGLKDYPAAVRDWDRVVELSDDADRRQYRLLRVAAIARAGDFARFRSETDGLLSGAKGSVEELIHLGACFAIAAGAAGPGRGAEGYAAKAVALVRQGVEAADPTRRAKVLQEAANHPDLKPLQGRADYREMVQALGGKRKCDE